MPIIIMHPMHIPETSLRPLSQLEGPYIIAQEATKPLLSAISATSIKRPVSEPQMKQDSGCHCPSRKAGTNSNLRTANIQSLDGGRWPAIASAKYRPQTSKIWKQPVSSCRKSARSGAHLCMTPGKTVMVTTKISHTLNACGHICRMTVPKFEHCETCATCNISSACNLRELERSARARSSMGLERSASRVARMSTTSWMRHEKQ
mmetsp:Transcript_96688/g.191695  ORF Transcript_96688/g.191695 Transcript_96688/m.191695 type:complete len:205 (+) Transcript_96688:291-905(+)